MKGLEFEIDTRGRLVTDITDRVQAFVSQAGGDGLLNVGAGLLNTFTNFKDVSARKVFDVFVRQLPEEWGIREENAEGPT